MRGLPLVLLAVAAFVLPGCVNTTGPDPDDFVTCPQWLTPTFTTPDGVQGDQTLLVATHVFYFNRTSQHIGPHADGGPVRGQEDQYDPYKNGLGAGRLEHGGHPLDVIRVELDLSPPNNGVEDGSVQLYASAADGSALRFYPDGPHTGEPMDLLVLPPGGASRTVFLPLAAPDEEANAQPIRVDWWFLPDADGDPDTPSAARVVARYVPMYRSWDGPCVDGTA